MHSRTILGIFYTYIWGISYLGLPPYSLFCICRLQIFTFSDSQQSFLCSIPSFRPYPSQDDDFIDITRLMATTKTLPTITWPDSMRKLGRPADVVPSDRTQFPNWTLTLDLSLKNCLHHPGSPPPHPCVQIEDALRRSDSTLGLRSVSLRLTPRGPPPSRTIRQVYC